MAQIKRRPMPRGKVFGKVVKDNPKDSKAKEASERRKGIKT